jgi:cytoskeleton protein RodZ
MPDDATRDVGTHLREARERAGITLREVAAATKISVPTLEALERNDVARLPGGIFVRAFVRAYAKQVGLDPEEAVRQFVARFPDAAVQESPATYEANPDRIDVDDVPAAGRGWRFVWWSLPIVAVVAYFGFGGRMACWTEVARSPAARAAAQAEPVPPGPATPVLTTPAAVPAAEPAQPAPAPVAAGAAAGAPAVPAPEVPAGAGQGAGAPAPAAEGAKTAPPGEGRFQLSLASRGLCWVTVRSDGAIVFTGTMNAGDRKDLAVGGSVSLTVGNAGAIDLALNGQAAKPLGVEGQVVTVRISADNLKTFLDRD